MKSSQLGEARRLWDEGLPMTEIAERIGVPYGTMAGYAWRNRDLFPWNDKHRRPQRSDEAQRAEIARLHSEGMGMTEIARTLGLTFPCVRYWVKKGLR